MVKRRKEEEIVGVLEFEGRTSEDPEVMYWLAEHKAQNGGKIRVSRGSTGVSPSGIQQGSGHGVVANAVRAGGARGSDRHVPELLQTAEDISTDKG